MSTSHIADADINVDDGEASVFAGSLKAPGAPIEKLNPLGKEVTLLSAVMLNVGQITG
ncbi:hypothetical protein H0H87_005445 [Tephrocybe sp. NHM501043]|nr:hypothetical protein H0H87_005445 [Tephrocybe sp. NHM501043]